MVLTDWCRMQKMDSTGEFLPLSDKHRGREAVTWLQSWFAYAGQSDESSLLLLSPILSFFFTQWVCANGCVPNSYAIASEVQHDHSQTFQYKVLPALLPHEVWSMLSEQSTHEHTLTVPSLWKDHTRFSTTQMCHWRFQYSRRTRNDAMRWKLIHFTELPKHGAMPRNERQTNVPNETVCHALLQNHGRPAVLVVVCMVEPWDPPVWCGGMLLGHNRLFSWK